MARRRAQPGEEPGPGLFDAPGSPSTAPSEPLPDAAAPWRDEPPAPAAGKAAPRAPRKKAAPSAALEESEKRPFTVGELSRELNSLLAGLGRIAVEGEIASLKRAPSGHIYFDLKDEEAKLECKVWRSQVERAFRATPADGQRVVVHGRIDVYAKRGSYSLIVDRVAPVGRGELLARYEELKRELERLRWFERCRPLPVLPQTIGIVTSRAGAALQDFLRTRSQRWPLYPVRLIHSSVQGAEAARELANAIARLDASGVDVIVVTRGGGSLEDLWAFNERPVAEAIRAASVPVVSGVGHESDTTLADLVADHRAHTPTDAARLVVPDRAAWQERLERAAGYLTGAMGDLVQSRVERLERARRARVLHSADWILFDRLRSLDGARRRLAAAAERVGVARERRLRELERRLVAVSPRARLEAWAARAREAGLRLGALVDGRLAHSEARMRELARGLEATSPLAVLGRGYSVTTRAGSETVVRDAAELAPGDEIVTRLGTGRVHSSVRAAADESS